MEKHIQFEDDNVIVTNTETNEVVYSGVYDYCEMKDENFVFDKTKGAYFFTEEYEGKTYKFKMEKVA